MAKILVDTSIIIDYLRTKDKDQTILYQLAEGKNELHASILTHTESYSGKSVWEEKEVRNTLKTLLRGIKILSLKEDVSEKAGEIRAKYGLQLVDAVIAATAINNKLTLATLNIKDFAKIDGVKLINL